MKSKRWFATHYTLHIRHIPNRLSSHELADRKKSAHVRNASRIPQEKKKHKKSHFLTRINIALTLHSPLILFFMHTTGFHLFNTRPLKSVLLMISNILFSPFYCNRSVIKRVIQNGHREWPFVIHIDSHEMNELCIAMNIKAKFDSWLTFIWKAMQSKSLSDEYGSE